MAKKTKTKTPVKVKSTGNYANPSNRPVVARNRAPVMSYVPDGVIVSNTEQLTGSVINADGTGTLQKNTYFLTPASTVEFPWLSRIARNYSKYRWKKLCVSYVPFAPTTFQGYYSMASAYDAEDALRFRTAPGGFAISNQPQFSIGPLYAGGAISSNEDHLGQGNWHGIEFDLSHNAHQWKLIDPGVPLTLNSGDEARLNQACGTYALVQYQGPDNGGQPVTVGALYVTYEIEFTQPAVPELNV
jgi:hypothetical protein